MLTQIDIQVPSNITLTPALIYATSNMDINIIKITHSALVTIQNLDTQATDNILDTTLHCTNLIPKETLQALRKTTILQYFFTTNRI
jgi:hypothetical protein